MRWLIVAGLVLGFGGESFVPNSLLARLSAGAAFGQAAFGATLGVLAVPVGVSVGGAAFVAARDGMTLGPGDQVRTTGGGVAVLTFFEGSEIQLTPDSQVQIQQTSSSAATQISLSQTLGTTVAHIQRLTNPPANVSTGTPAATLVVRGTLYTLTMKCYASPPSPPRTPLLTFPRRVSGSPCPLRDEALYTDGETLWETRAWQDRATNDSFDTVQPDWRRVSRDGRTPVSRRRRQLLG